MLVSYGNKVEESELYLLCQVPFPRLKGNIAVWDGLFVKDGLTAECFH